MATDIKLGSLYHDYDPKGLREAEQALRNYAAASKAAVGSASIAQAHERTARAAKDEARADTDLTDRIKLLGLQSRSLRNEYEAGVITKQTVIEQANRLRDAALKEASAITNAERATTGGAKAYNDLLIAAGRAERTLATVEGRTTKLGFSGNLAVGVTNSLRGSLLALGPAGNAAGGALGIMSSRFGSLQVAGDAAETTMQRLIVTGRVLQGLLPLLAIGGLALATAALIRFGDRAAEVADKVDKGSQAAGLSAETYQELRYVFDLGGVSADQFGTAMETLNRRIGKAADGEKTYADAFAQLGVSIRDGQGNIRDTEDVLNDVIVALERFPSAAQKAQAASDLMGDEIGGKLLPPSTRARTPSTRCARRPGTWASSSPMRACNPWCSTRTP